jgi:hypothetical protein
MSGQQEKTGTLDKSGAGCRLFCLLVAVCETTPKGCD